MTCVSISGASFEHKSSPESFNSGLYRQYMVWSEASRASILWKSGSSVHTRAVRKSPEPFGSGLCRRYPLPYCTRTALVSSAPFADSSICSYKPVLTLTQVSFMECFAMMTSPTR